MIGAYGWTWEYIDEEMTIPRLMAISKRWEKIPPVDVTLAGLAKGFGVERKRVESSAAATQSNDRRSLFDDLRAAGVKPGKVPEWLSAQVQTPTSK